MKDRSTIRRNIISGRPSCRASSSGSIYNTHTLKGDKGRFKEFTHTNIFISLSLGDDSSVEPEWLSGIFFLLLVYH